MSRGNIDWFHLVHPDDYGGYPFLSLVQQRIRKPNGTEEYEDPYVAIIVNQTEDALLLYDIDALREDEEVLICQAIEWYNNGEKEPLTVQLSRNGIAGAYSHALRNVALLGLHKVIGPIPQYDFSIISKRSVKMSDLRKQQKNQSNQ